MDEPGDQGQRPWTSGPASPQDRLPGQVAQLEGLATSRDGYVQNVLAAAKFNHAYEMAKIGKAGRPQRVGHVAADGQRLPAR